MKKFLLLAAFLLLNLFSFSQTVSVAIVNTALKACDINDVKATFTSTGQHKLKIKGGVIFGSNTHVACGKSLIFLPLLYSKLVDASVCV